MLLLNEACNAVCIVQKKRSKVIKRKFVVCLGWIFLVRLAGLYSEFYSIHLKYKLLFSAFAV